jgi:hypothetical protein
MGYEDSINDHLNSTTYTYLQKNTGVAKRLNFSSKTIRK